MISVIMRIDHVFYGMSEPILQKLFDGHRLFRIVECIHKDNTFLRNDGAGSYLGVKFARKNIDVVSDALTNHKPIQCPLLCD